jgi:hypothetical protein
MGDCQTGTSGNFGDILTPEIFKHFNIPISYVSDHNKDFDALCVGSIIKFAKPGTIVLGSGLMSNKNPVCIAAEYRFVRGPITRNKILSAGGYCPEIYGDPGLLCPLFCNESYKEFDIGIIPHAIHYNRVKQQYPNKNIINLNTTDIYKTIKEITKCKKIISGSLHGIIVANAYNIPAAWVNLGNIKGDGTKFLDYFSSIGISNAVTSALDDPIFYSPKKDLIPNIVKEFEKISYA